MRRFRRICRGLEGGESSGDEDEDEVEEIEWVEVGDTSCLEKPGTPDGLNDEMATEV